MRLNDRIDIAIVGAGPAGLAAAAAAKQAGASDVLVLERNSFPGGVLPQCVHDGFGLHLFQRSMTGPEYAAEWLGRAQDAGADIALSTTVISMDVQRASGSGASKNPYPFRLTVAGEPAGGVTTIAARSVVMATGCHERTRGALGLPGTRPSGVMTAGTAQYLMNIKNELPGDKVVILGSGDIGLIMARRLTLEGAEVRMVLGMEGTGLLRNHIRCIEDFNIPFRYGWGVASLHGQGRLKGVTIAPLRDDGSLDMANKQYLRANLLLLACGLIPERQLLDAMEQHDEGTEDATTIPGLFLCGNANAPHDLVDQVTQEGIEAGFSAARFAAALAGKQIHPLTKEIADMREKPIAEATGSMSQLRLERSSDDPSSTRYIPCTVCPTGCIITVTLDEDGRFLKTVTGNACQRGRSYAEAEATNPKRLFTGTVRVTTDTGIEHMSLKLLPVRTSTEVAKDQLIAVSRACRRIRPTLPVKIGDIIQHDIANTGADLIACADRTTNCLVNASPSQGVAR